MKIAIIGPAGVGKSTVAYSLSTTLDIPYLAEPVEKFTKLENYSDHSMEAISEQILEESNNALLHAGDRFISDFSTSQCLAYGLVNNCHPLVLPLRLDAIIQLYADPCTILRRITGRGRSFESRYSHRYIRDLCDAFDHCMGDAVELHSPKLYVRMSAEADKSTVFDKILTLLSREFDL